MSLYLRVGTSGQVDPGYAVTLEQHQSAVITVPAKADEFTGTSDLNIAMYDLGFARPQWEPKQLHAERRSARGGGTGLGDGVHGHATAAEYGTTQITQPCAEGRHEAACGRQVGRRGVARPDTGIWRIYGTLIQVASSDWHATAPHECDLVPCSRP